MQTPGSTPAMTILAHLLRPQGRKGEILAELHTDFPEQFAERDGLSLRSSTHSLQPAVVESHWLPTGRNAGRIVLKLAGVDSISAAEMIAGCDLVVRAEQRIILNEADEQYITDLLDCVVFDGTRSVGTIVDVQFPASASGVRLDGAAPLLVVHSPEGAELLIPFAKLWIDEIDIAGKRVLMQLPQGLLEINT